MLREVALIEVCYVVEMRVSDLYVAVGLVNVTEDVGFWLDLLHTLEQSLAAYALSREDWLGYCVQNAKWWRMSH